MCRWAERLKTLSDKVMPREINLTIPSGDLKLVDQNDDWVFDPSDSVIIGEQPIEGQSLSPQIAKEMLLEYGVNLTSLYGVHFKQLDDYLDGISSCIHRSAYYGEYCDPRYPDSAAKEAGIVFNPKRFMDVLKEEHRTAYESGFRYAESSAEAGKVEEVAICLEKAERSARLVKFPFGEDRAIRITRKANFVAYEKTLQWFEENSSEDVGLIADKILELRGYAKAAHIAVDEGRVREILKRAYRMAYEELQWRDVKGSYLPNLVSRIEDLQKFAKKYGFEFDEQAARALIKAAREQAGQECREEISKKEAAIAAGRDFLSYDLDSIGKLCALAAEGELLARFNQIDRYNHLQFCQRITDITCEEEKCPSVQGKSGYITTVIGAARLAARAGNGELIDAELDNARRCAELWHLQFDEGIVRDPEIIGGWRLSSHRLFKEALRVVSEEENYKGVYNAKEFLRQARLDAQHGGILSEFDEEKARQIVIDGYKKVYQGTIGRIVSFAAEGRIDLNFEVEKARHQAVRAGIVFDEEGLSKQIKAGYKTAYGREMGFIKGAAEEGDIEQMERNVSDAQTYAKNAEITFDEAWIKWPEVKKAYENAYLEELDEAEDCAYQENVNEVSRILEEARKYAVNAGIVFDDKRAAQIIAKGARLAYRTAMRRAENYAAEGDVSSMESSLATARELGPLSGMSPADTAPLSPAMRRAYRLECEKLIAKIRLETRKNRHVLHLLCNACRFAPLAGLLPDEIKIGTINLLELAGRESLKVWLKAEKEAARGDNGGSINMDSWLRELSSLAKITADQFDETRAAKIRTKWYNTAYEKQMQMAEHYSKKNLSPGCVIACLENAREYAESASIKFDEQRERNICRNAFALTMRKADEIAAGRPDREFLVRYGRGSLIFGDIVDHFIKSAKELAQKTGDKFDEAGLSQNLKRYFSKKHTETMQEARRTATEGRFDDDVDEEVDKKLDEARHYAVLAGLSFDEQTANRIRTSF